MVVFPRLKRWQIRGLIVLSVIVVSMGLAVRYPHILKYFREIFPSFSVSKGNPWVLDLRTVYRQCGHEEHQSFEYLGEGALQKAMTKYSELQVNEINPYFVSATNHLKQFCPTCHQNAFLGLSERKVAVIRGTPAHPGPVAELTDIVIDRLPEAEKNDLKAGIPFHDEKEKLQLLEGINGLIVN